jgi:membrane fusion protein, multidrug efflux system
MTDEKEKRSRRGWLIWLAPAALAALIGLMVALIANRPPEDVEEPPERAVPVAVKTVSPRPMPDRRILPGRIAAESSALIAGENPGRIIELPVDEGDDVDRGDLLMRVDDRLFRTALRRAEIEYREAQKDLDRRRELREAGALSESEMDAVQTRFDLAEAALEEARVVLDKCSIRSPIDGTVNRRLMELGEYVNEGQTVFEVVQSDPVRVRFDVPERDVGGVELGRDMAFEISALDGATRTGRVVFASEAAQPGNNAFRVELAADNADGRLRPGMIARVDFVRRTIPDAIAVSLAAVVPQKGEHVVFVVEEDRAVRRRVTIHAIVGHEAILGEGVEGGDRVVVEGQRALIDGALVTVSAAGDDAP